MRKTAWTTDSFTVDLPDGRTGQLLAYTNWWNEMAATLELATPGARILARVTSEERCEIARRIRWVLDPAHHSGTYVDTEDRLRFGMTYVGRPEVYVGLTFLAETDGGTSARFEATMAREDALRFADQIDVPVGTLFDEFAASSMEVAK